MYNNDNTWREMQSFLPVENRLTSKNMPDEYYYKIDNINLHIDHYRTDKPKATIVIFHGVGGNGRLLSFIAVPLSQQGYEVICPDLPLYGYTKYNGEISYQTWVDCGTEIVSHFRKNNIPLFVFGLSAGGMLAYQVACRCCKLNGIIATCLLDQRIPLVTQKTAISPLVAKLSKPFLKLLNQPLAKVKLPMKAVSNMKAIVNNRELAKLLMADNRSSGTKVSIAFLYTMLNPQIEIEANQFHKCPLLLVHPENDRWTDISLSRLFFNKLSCKKELIMLDGAGHFPIETEGCKNLEIACIRFIEKYS
ncbi:MULTISPECIES: alpha/beta hydrolase [unclassified Sedimentibacter]|uniref:alpha/beta hydrolase n=1 Tax=unclassified Sedimentibacter TaxID=2649220 RepID=UPI0027DF03CE|nr:alpha/beta hydrolase [Sedimentibacter sp. MB35-C1]WMJ78692.1 alpha/beta hydrolase [Sedimentibacter sp. MB35-C1]